MTGGFGSNDEWAVVEQKPKTIERDSLRVVLFLTTYSMLSQIGRTSRYGGLIGVRDHVSNGFHLIMNGLLSNCRRG